MFLASYGLGAVSKIYNRHLYEECRIEIDVRGWVARMVALLTNFENMKDKPEGISKAVFHKRLSRILADSPDLDPGEVAVGKKNFVNVVSLVVESVSKIPKALVVMMWHHVLLEAFNYLVLKAL